MPYGIPQSKGGDNAKNIKKMENCVEGVMKENQKLTKSSAIAICKVRLGFVEKKN